MLLLTSPTVKKYQEIKSRLIQALGSSLEQRIQRILDLPPLEPSEKPSIWLARIRSIAGSNVSLDGPWPFVILLKKLPAPVRELASIENLN